MFFFLLVVSVTSLLCDFRVFSCDKNCINKVKLTPSRLVVKHGDPASATCTLCQLCQSRHFSLEVSVGNLTNNGTGILWSVHSMTEWGTNVLCFYYDLSYHMCCTALPVNVYKPPDSVSISFTNHSGPMFEGHQYTLQCEVHNVAPAADLTVTFYRGWTPLGQLKSNRSDLTPLTEVFTQDINTTKEDDGVQFWCEGILELGPEGPQHPPVVKSPNITATVHYEPQLEESPRPDPIVVTEGNSLQLNCSAVGNPSPTYSWQLPHSTLLIPNADTHIINSVTAEDEGLYTCHVSNKVGAVSVSFNVVVKGLELTSPPQSSTTSTKATTTKMTTVAPNSSTSSTPIKQLHTLFPAFILCCGLTSYRNN